MICCRMVHWHAAIWRHSCDLIRRMKLNLQSSAGLMRKSSLTMAAVALIVLSARADSAVAQGGSGDRIDKVSNHRLAGSSYTSLRGVSYSQCERRCLAEPQCKALELIRGGGATGLCRLFSSVGAAHVSQNADIGYKRPGLAADKMLPPAAKPVPKVTAVPPHAPPKPEVHVKPAPPHGAGSGPKITSVPSPAPHKGEPKRRRRMP